MGKMKAAYAAGKEDQPETKNTEKKRKNESQNGKITKFLKKLIKYNPFLTCLVKYWIAFIESRMVIRYAL